MNNQFALQGIDELNEKLKAINKDLKFKGGKLALRRAANFIADKARQYEKSFIDDPKTPNDISKNISVQFGRKRFKTTGDLMFRVGVQGGAILNDGKKAGKGGYTFYWRFIEFGTERIAAHPFMRPALQNNYFKAEQIFVHEYKRSIDKTVKRVRKRSA